LRLKGRLRQKKGDDRAAVSIFPVTAWAAALSSGRCACFRPVSVDDRFAEQTFGDAAGDFPFAHDHLFNPQGGQMIDMGVGMGASAKRRWT
jgi:hypothetical protein